MKPWVWTLLISLILWKPASLAFAQCGEAGSLPSVNHGASPEKDIQQVFELLNGTPTTDEALKTPKNSKSSLNGVEALKDAQIVPAKRVGMYVLADPYNKISQNIKLEKGEVFKDDTYEKILPLAYVPTRFFSNSVNKELRFAFTQDKKTLKEITVYSANYKTADGVGVGTSEKILKEKFKNCERRGKNDPYYWVCPGITFLIRKSAVSSCTVFQD